MTIEAWADASIYHYIQRCRIGFVIHKNGQEIKRVVQDVPYPDNIISLEKRAVRECWEELKRLGYNPDKCTIYTDCRHAPQAAPATWIPRDLNKAHEVVRLSRQERRKLKEA